MKKINATTIIVVVLTTFFACKSTQKALYSSKNCGLERLEWAEADDDFEKKKNGDVNANINLNVDTLNSGIPLKGTGSVEIGGELKTFIHKKTKKKVNVSQEFYEQYSKSRSALCSIYEGLENGTINSNQGKREAEVLYLEIVRMFSGLE